MKGFHDRVISLQWKRKFFTTHVIVFFKNQKIILIKPQIIDTKVHKYTSNHGGEGRTEFKLETSYRLIPLHKSKINNHSIPRKPRLCARFGWTTMNHAFTSPTSKVEMRVKVIHKQTDESDKTDRHNFGNRYHIFNWIGIYSDKNPIRVLTGKVIS